MKRISHTTRSRDPILHIEAPGAIVNITVGLTDIHGQSVTHVEIIADGDRFSRSPWWVNGEVGNLGQGMRVIQTKSKEA